ncbi:hypothetical protein MTR67_024223 [Solanum verrucosum]|uniref:Mitochondrial protein n=1 Tax=Solanum verrucosum TaxID=315347 RepID=A0AAF0QX25_SOLVR|nr:hypothetical protein MTR67_024223 [Solanum verrucosum]
MDAHILSTLNTKLHVGDSPLFDDPTLYRTIVGALQYVTLTRPDLAFVVNKVCQFMDSPSQNQWAAVKCILRYLKLTMHQRFVIPRSSNLVLQAFTDSDWAGSSDDRKSTSGYTIFLGNASISWSSKSDINNNSLVLASGEYHVITPLIQILVIFLVIS